MDLHPALEENLAAIPIGVCGIFIGSNGARADLATRVKDGWVDGEGRYFNPVARDCYSVFLRLPDGFTQFTAAPRHAILEQRKKTA